MAKIRRRLALLSAKVWVMYDGRVRHGGYAIFSQKYWIRLVWTQYMREIFWLSWLKTVIVEFFWNGTKRGKVQICFCTYVLTKSTKMRTNSKDSSNKVRSHFLTNFLWLSFDYLPLAITVNVNHFEFKKYYFSFLIIELWNWGSENLLLKRKFQV